MKISLTEAPGTTLINVPMGTVFHFPGRPDAIYIRGWDGFIRIDDGKTPSPSIGVNGNPFYDHYVHKEVITLSRLAVAP